MMRLILQQRIASLWEAEQHVYSIPESGSMASPHWTRLTSEHRVGLRSRAIQIWKNYLENDEALVPHAPIIVPEYRHMLTQPDGELIVEEN